MKIERVTDLGVFQKKREEWNNFLDSSDLNSIFLSHEWFFSWTQCLSENNTPEILFFRNKSGDLCGIAPLMRDGETLRFLASREVTDYCDLISCRGNRAVFYEGLLKYLSENYPGLKNIELVNIKNSSPTLTFLPRLAGKFGFSCAIREAEVAPILELPSTYENYLDLLNRKNRHELRRKLRRMESLEKVQIKKIQNIKDLKFSVDAFIKLHKASGPEKERFWKKPGMEDFFSEVIHRFFLKGWVELNLLYAKDILLAVLLNFSYLDKIYFYNVAYIRDFVKYSPGIYLFDASIRQAISEKKKHADFLRGDEKYKFDLGAKVCKIHDLILTMREK